MRLGVLKIFFLAYIVCFINLIKTCPTNLGYKLLSENKISYEDIQELNFNLLDFKSTAGV